MGLGTGEAVQTYNVNLININIILTVNYPNKMNTIAIDLSNKTNDSKWYAVYTRPRWEKNVSEIIDQMFRYELAAGSHRALFGVRRPRRPR